MSDQKVEIEISTKATGTGSQQTVTGLKDVKAATVDAGTATVKTNEETQKSDEKATGKKAELKKMVQELAREIPGLGLAWRAVTNPITAAVTVMAVSVAALKRGFADFKAAMTMGDWLDAAEGAKVYADSLAKSEVQMAQLGITIANLSASRQTDADKIAATIKLLDEELEANNKILAARKQAELAGAKTPADVEEIESRYANNTTAARRKHAEAVMQQRNLEMGGLARNIPAVEEEAKTAQMRIEELKARQEQLAEERKIAEENKATAKDENKKARAALVGRGLGFGDAAHGDIGGAYRRALESQRDNSGAVVESQAALIEKQKAEERRIAIELAQNENAQANRMSGLGQMNQRRNALEAVMLTDAGSESRTRRTEDEVEHQRQVTAFTKNPAGAPSQALMKQLGFNDKQIENIFAGLLNHTIKQSQVLAEMDRRVAALDSRMQAQR